tara:strand:+ start:160 stop:1365 length:1206 start_codon:yes stop_codon:yes gene_type:complete
MIKKQPKLYLLIVCLILVLPITIHADSIKKIWDFSIDDIFSTTSISTNFSPVLSGTKLVFGDLKGNVKTLDITNRKVEKIIKLPIAVERSIKFTSKSLKNYVVFSGKHLTNGKHYYCSIDVKNKKIKGVVAHNNDLISFGEFALFEKNNNFIIFNPKVGRGVYRQKTTFSILKPIYTQDYNRNVFQSNQNEVVDIKVPNFAASLIMSSKSNKKDVLEFNTVVTIEKNIIADNIDSEILYFHRNNGLIGLLDVKKRKIIWEKKYFSSDTKIQGPYIAGKNLFYLVSYSGKSKNKERLGKIIALKKDSGLASWISKDLPFNNFGIVHFDKYIISSDLAGNILFLNIKNGKIEDKINVGKGISKPIISGRNIFIVTNSDIIMLESKRLRFRIKLLGRKIKKYLT